jgi:hypothetical protein
LGELGGSPSVGCGECRDISNIGFYTRWPMGLRINKKLIIASTLATMLFFSLIFYIFLGLAKAGRRGRGRMVLLVALSLFVALTLLGPHRTSRFGDVGFVIQTELDVFAE